MAGSERIGSHHVATFPAGGSESNVLDLRAGCFGALLVPSGSELIGKTLQVLAHFPAGELADTELLSAEKTLAAGNNHFSADELTQLAAVGFAKLRLNSAVAAEATAVLLWKS